MKKPSSPSRPKRPAKKAAAKPAARKPRTPAARKATATAPAPGPALPPLLVKIVEALDAKKTADIQVLDVSALSSITDFLVIGTATSSPHLRALRVELEKVIDAARAPILGMDTGRESGWTVIDAFDIMIHLLTPDNRAKYRLELLWRDARPVPMTAKS
jgi:ribosome-associated protein